MTTISGIELLGTLTFKGKEPLRKREAGQAYFTYFWQHHIYDADPNRARLAAAIYQLVRNGIAHLFLAVSER